MMFPGDDYSTTLFLGDLSVHCTERDIRKLFRPFGTIEAIRIKRGSNTKTNLSYGFIKFSDRQSAELAITQVNGLMFLGRCIRIGWATGKDSPKLPSDMFDNEGNNSPSLPSTLNDHKNNKSARKETAQIHVSFISKQVEHLISEATLRSLFSNYGEVLDVALKKSQFDKNLRIQNGYGFVHFELSPDGVRGAIAAVNALHQVTIDRITYDCSISHALADYLVSHGIPLPRGTTHPSLTNNKKQYARSEQLSLPLSTPEDSVAREIGLTSSINWLENNTEKTSTKIDNNGTSNARLFNSSFPAHLSLLPLQDRLDIVGESAVFRTKVVTGPTMYLGGKSNTITEPFIDDLDRFDQQYISREYDSPSAGGSIPLIRSHSASQLASHSYSSRYPLSTNYLPTTSLSLPQRPDSYYHHHSSLSATENAYYRPLESPHRLQTNNFHQNAPHYPNQPRLCEDHHDHKFSFPSHSSHSNKHADIYPSHQHQNHNASHHPHLVSHSHIHAPRLSPHQANHLPYSPHAATMGSSSAIEARQRQQHQPLPHSEAYATHGRPIISSNHLPAHITGQRGANYLYNNPVHERQDQINMHHTYERENELSSSSLYYVKMQEKESIPLTSKLSLNSLDSEQDLSLSHFSSFSTNKSLPTTGMNTSSLSINPTHLDSSSSIDITGMNESNFKNPMHRVNSLQSSSFTTSFPPAILPPSQSQSTSAASSAYQILAPDGTELASYSSGL